jgi:hypothetical protein
MFPNSTNLPIENAPEEEWPAFQSEIMGDIAFRLAGLPDAEYTLEFGWCELIFGDPDTRLFDLAINGEQVLSRFDMFQEPEGVSVPSHVVSKPGQWKASSRSSSPPARTWPP